MSVEARGHPAMGALVGRELELVDHLGGGGFDGGNDADGLEQYGLIAGRWRGASMDIDGPPMSNAGAISGALTHVKKPDGYDAAVWPDASVEGAVSAGAAVPSHSIEVFTAANCATSDAFAATDAFADADAVADAFADADADADAVTTIADPPTPLSSVGAGSEWPDGMDAAEAHQAIHVPSDGNPSAVATHLSASLADPFSSAFDHLDQLESLGASFGIAPTPLGTSAEGSRPDADDSLALFGVDLVGVAGPFASVVSAAPAADGLGLAGSLGDPFTATCFGDEALIGDMSSLSGLAGGAAPSASNASRLLDHGAPDGGAVSGDACAEGAWSAGVLDAFGLMPRDLGGDDALHEALLTVAATSGAATVRAVPPLSAAQAAEDGSAA